MEQELFQLLESINQNANITQKKMASLCGISVGKVNYLIHSLTMENYLYSEKKGRSISYYLTEKGIHFLESGIEAYQGKKVNIHQEPMREIKQAVILAAGNRKELPKPSCLMEIDDQPLLKRTIDILQENGIQQILVVTGYKSEKFEEERAFSQLQFAENTKYKWTGSMASLALAQDFITDDFLLLEGDVLIEERAIRELLVHPQRDCVLITDESGSGDESFVEIKNGYLHKISKEIHQFNHIDGEMVGICKLSFEVFSKMVEDFKIYNRNPYMNYEYMLLDVSRQYNIGYLKMHNLVWGEIDTEQHYDNIMKKTYPILKRKEAEFRAAQIRGHLMEALHLPYEEIREIQPFGGMTNKNFRAVVGGKEYVLRIPGNGTAQMINRRDEKLNSTLASNMGLDTGLIYFNEETGVKLAEMIPNAETLNPKTAKRQDYMELTTDILRSLHQSDLQMANEFAVFGKMAAYERLMVEASGKPYEEYEKIKAKVLALKAIYESMNIRLVPCHNDTVPENFVKSGDDKIYLIDWEYAGLNDPMWDVAAHSLECDFSSEDEELYLSLYFRSEQVPLDILQRVLMNKIFQDFLWSIWTIIKEAQGDDFGTYGIDRFNRAKENLNHPIIRDLIHD